MPLARPLAVITTSGTDPEVLVAPEAAGAAAAGLDLVGDEQDAVAVARSRSPARNAVGPGT